MLKSRRRFERWVKLWKPACVGSYWKCREYQKKRFPHNTIKEDLHAIKTYVEKPHTLLHHLQRVLRIPQSLGLHEGLSSENGQNVWIRYPETEIANTKTVSPAPYNSEALKHIQLYTVPSTQWATVTALSLRVRDKWLDLTSLKMLTWQKCYERFPILDVCRGNEKCVGLSAWIGRFVKF